MSEVKVKMDTLQIHRCRFPDIAPRPIGAMALNPTHTVLAVAFDTGDIELYLIEDQVTFSCILVCGGFNAGI